MTKLGYTWYTKDWKTNEIVFNLTLELRGLYREFIDFAYETDNVFTIKPRYWCRMLDISKHKFDTLFARLIDLELIIQDGDIFYIPSVESRMVKIRAGKLGGLTPKQNGKQNPKQKENQRERETKRETKSILVRKTDFKKSLSPFLENYSSDILNNFFEYWSEHGERDKKMRFEKQKSFGLSRRLATWLKNQKSFEKEKSSGTKEKINAATLIQKKYGLK